MGGLAQMVVGAVGALLVGTGLIAVLASNWDDFPRWVRIALALGPLAVTQAVAVDAAVQPRGPSLAFPWLAMLSAAAVLLFPLDRSGIAEPLARKPQVLLGGLALVIMALIATYEDPARDFVRSVGPALGLSWCWLLLAVVVGFAFLAFRQGAARIGAALLALLVILRMADADVSLLVKGLAFIVIGSGFLAFNAFATRRRRVVAAGGSPA